MLQIIKFLTEIKNNENIRFPLSHRQSYASLSIARLNGNFYVMCDYIQCNGIIFIDKAYTHPMNIVKSKRASGT